MDNRFIRLASAAALAFSLTVAGRAPAADYKLLNAAYDVSRDVYKELDTTFVAEWQKAHPGDTVAIEQSHGGSSKQARAVIDGLPADFIAMNSSLDIDAVAKAGLLPADWPKLLPDAASPSWSTILFLVRKGNPKHIKDWDDLVKPGIGIATPNPKTSGNARYSYLAAWQYARVHNGGDEAKAREFVTRFIGNVPVFASGGRDATTNFVERNVGDVLITFENEVRLIAAEFKDRQLEIVVPSLSVRADNPIAVVAKVAQKNGTTAVAQGYAQFHFSPAAQEIFVKYGLRPTDPAVLKRHQAEFPQVKLFTVDEAFGGWEKAQQTHFSDGGIFDQIVGAKR